MPRIDAFVAILVMIAIFIAALDIYRYINIMAALNQYDDVQYGPDNLPFPIPITFTAAQKTASLLFSSANFYRTVILNNVQIPILLGTDISPGTIWFSPNTFLPGGVFNGTKANSAVVYPNAQTAQILMDSEFYHDIKIDYKLTKLDGSNYINNRNLRGTLVRADGITPYDSSIYGDVQPNPGAHDRMQFSGSIVHNLGDICQINLNVAQDNFRGDRSDTLITIFRISWDTLGIMSTTEFTD